jgi:hypothetical protein
MASRTSGHSPRLGGLLRYQDFFMLWKDADPDIPILKQAKAEYPKLQ